MAVQRRARAARATFWSLASSIFVFRACSQGSWGASLLFVPGFTGMHGVRDGCLPRPRVTRVEDAKKSASTVRRAGVAGASDTLGISPAWASPEGGLATAVPAAILLLGAVALLIAAKRAIDGPPVLDLPPESLRGRTIVITGANAGLGFEAAVRLAAAGARVVATARTEEKARAAEAAIKAASGSSDVHAFVLDLASMSSVRAFVDSLKGEKFGGRVDVLINNAGVMAVPERVQTEDGFELQLGVNHLGHFALTGLLLPQLRNTEGCARVICVSSSAHCIGDADALLGMLSTEEVGGSSSTSYSAWPVYAASKLANVVFAKELDRRFRLSGMKATAVSLHPGVCPTGLSRYVVSGEDQDLEEVYEQMPGPVQSFMQGMRSFLRPVSQGANSHVFLAAGSDGGYDCSGGAYFVDMEPVEPHSRAGDPALGRELWRASERLTGVRWDLLDT